MSDCPSSQFKYKVNAACIFENEAFVTSVLLVLCVLFLIANWLFVRKANKTLLKMTTQSPEVNWDETYCKFSWWGVYFVKISLIIAAVQTTVYAI